MPTGILATATMDAAMVAASRLGGSAFTSDRLGPALIGRWAAGLARGRWRSDDIVDEPPQPGELAIGLMTHYATGIVLSQVFLLLAGRRSDASIALGGTAFGVASSVLPLLVMFPSMGYGWCGRRSGDALRLTRIMAVGHLAFGVGIGLWAPRRPARRVAGP